MAQQFHNGGQHNNSVTISNRDSHRYAVINHPEMGKHSKTYAQRVRRHHFYTIANRLKLYGEEFNQFADRLYR